jgi:hypothetical protein
MNKFSRFKTTHLKIIILTLFIFGCISSGTKVHIKNESGHDLYDLVLSGSGFSQKVAELKDGAKTTIEVFPTGDSSLNLQFFANGKKYDLPQDTYFEAGGAYTVFVKIGNNFKVNVRVEI